MSTRSTGELAAPVQVGLLITAAEDFRAASYPLFAEGLVDCIEWNIDMGWSSRGVPDWIAALLDVYGQAGRLHGHGVEFSLLSARLSSGAPAVDHSGGSQRVRRAGGPASAVSGSSGQRCLGYFRWSSLRTLG